MRLLVAAALAGTFSLAALLPACFDPSYNCRILCDDDQQGCPPGFLCRGGLCARPEIQMCPLPERDAGPDTGQDGGGNGAPDARPEAMPPPDEICVWTNSCFELTPEIKAGLALWLDPTNLPAVGTKISVWQDRSGQANDAYPGNAAEPPTVVQNGLALAPGKLAAGLRVPHHASFNFGTGDFVVLVVGGVSTTSTRLYMKSSTDRLDPEQVVIGWANATIDMLGVQGLVNEATIFPPPVPPDRPVKLFGLTRAGDRAELRVNGAVVGAADVMPGRSTDSREDVFLGQSGATGNGADSLGAVVVVRGSVPPSDVAALESFLASLFGIQLAR